MHATKQCGINDTWATQTSSHSHSGEEGSTWQRIPGEGGG